MLVSRIILFPRDSCRINTICFCYQERGNLCQMEVEVTNFLVEKAEVRKNVFQYPL